MDQTEAEIQELEKMNLLVQTESKEVANARVNSPVVAVETSLAMFVKDAFDVTRKDFEFGQVIEESLITDLQDDKLNPNQKIALYSSYAVNNNDKISKLLAPIMQLMTARQQAELAAAAQVASTQVAATTVSNDLNKTAPRDVLQGMAQLQNLLSKLNPIIDVKQD
jgi:hypothetical protein